VHYRNAVTAIAGVGGAVGTHQGVVGQLLADDPAEHAGAFAVNDADGLETCQVGVI